MRGRVFAPLLLAVAPLVYLLFRTRNFYWDGMAFALDIEKHLPLGQLLHANHLIYTVFGAGLYRTATVLGIDTRALFLMQIANCLIAAGCVALVYVILRHENVDKGASVAGALMFAFSATWWKFATDADAYVISLFLVLVAYLAIVRKAHPWIAGIAHAGAMMFHQLAIFFLPVGLLGIRTGAGKWLYLVAACLPVGVAYVVSYGIANATWSLGGFVGWVTRHAPDSGFSFNLIDSLFFTTRGTLRLLFGGRLRDVVPDAVSAIFVVALLAVVLVLGWRVRKIRGARLVPVPRELLAWIAVYAAFLLFWMPQNTFYRLFYLPPLVMAAVIAFRTAPWLRVVLSSFAAAMFLWNFTFVIRPQARTEYNPALQFALNQRQRWPSGTPILFHNFHPDLWTICYFSKQAAWIGMERFDPALLNEWLREARGRGQLLWLEATAYDFLIADAGGRAWITAQSQGEPLIYNDGKREFRFHSVR